MTTLAACLGLYLGLYPNAAASNRGTAAGDVGSARQWSPDHKTLASVQSELLFATPDGANSCLYFNSQPVYPAKCKPRPKATYRHIHTFLSPIEWSPDSRNAALIVKIFDWEYLDPFNRYFDGESSDVRYYLVIAGTDGAVSGYGLKGIAVPPQLQWRSNSQITLNGQMFDLSAHPPTSIP